MPKLCLDCGHDSHTYRKGAFVCDKCGKGGTENRSQKCQWGVHSACRGKMWIPATGPDRWGQKRKWKVAPCGCTCHKQEGVKQQ